MDPSDVLRGKATVDAHQLVRLIHDVNPTGKGIPPKKESERYRIKSRLQSLLVRRFSDRLAVTQPDPSHPKLVAFSLPRHDEDACHAFIDELDEDARAWTQRQIDEQLTGEITDIETELGKGPEQSARSGLPYSATDAVDAEPRSKTGIAGQDLPREELIRRGHDALAEYDYDAAEACYARALKLFPDNPDPALSLLELYVNHLAAYETASALSDSIPMTVKKDDRVRILLAMALARCGRIDDALELIRRVDHPNAAEVYLISAKHYAGKGDLNGAQKLLGILRSLEQPELVPEIEKLAESIRSLQAKELVPLEKEMMSAWEQGRATDSFNLAQKLLSVSPDNKAAQGIRHRFERRQLEERVEKLLQLAVEAKKNEDFSREAELLGRAIAIGGETGSLSERLQHARNEARRKKVETEIRNVTDLWASGSKKAALTQCARLSIQQRGRIRKMIPDPRLAWLDETLSTQAATKAEKHAEAVLALGRFKAALNEGKEPESIISGMKPHAKILRSVHEAQDLLQKAEKMSRALKVETARGLLRDALGSLETGDLDKARGSMDSVKATDLHDNDRRIFEETSRRIAHLAKRKRLEQRYTDSHDRADHFAAREASGELAMLTEHDAAAYWRERSEEQTDLIAKKWSLLAFDISKLPPCYANLGLLVMTEDSNFCLLPDGRHLLAATSHERWVFLRTFSIDHQGFEKGIIFRTPRPLSLSNIYPVGDSLWIIGSEASALELSLEPLGIRSWHDYSDHVGQDEMPEGVWLFPRRKSLWLYKRDRESVGDDAVEIIDTDQRRAVRRLRSSAGFPAPIDAGERCCMLLQHVITGTVQVYSARGRPMESFAPRDHMATNSAAVHPNGSDLVLLPFHESLSIDPFRDDDEEPEGDPTLGLEVWPNPEERYKRLEIEGTNGDLPHLVHTSLDAGILLVLFQDAFAEDIRFNLAAFRDAKAGFDLLYRMEVPRDSTLTCDEFSRHVAAVYLRNDRLQAVLLDENPPVCASGDDHSIESCIPRFDVRYDLCNKPTGALNAMSLAYMMQIKHSSPRELYEIIRSIKEPGARSPDEIAAFRNALSRALRLEEAQDIAEWMRVHHPDHYSVLLHLAEQAARDMNWSETVSLLEGIPRADLDDGTARHLCHLLGMGYFGDGDMEKALNTWLDGKRYEDGECDLEPYIEYARLTLMPEEERREQKSAILSELRVYESVDDCLARKRHGDAVSAIEKAGAMQRGELQILARQTWAYLHLDIARGEVKWLSKVIALANYREWHSDKFLRDSLVLPSYIETWPESRLDDIAAQAESWLEGL